MKKTKIALLSISALLGAATLVGCGNTGGDSAHPGEETETSTSDGRRFNIYFSQELNDLGGNLEIAKDTRFLLWKHISVPGGTYTLEVLSGNVEVDNHVIVAKGYGNFKIKISAVSEDGKNTQTKSLTGNVVSEAKLAFNKLWDEAGKEGNYTATSEFHGEARHNERYVEFLNGQNQATGAKTWLGNVFDEKSGHWYTYAYSDVNPSKVEWNQGYGQNHLILGTTPGWKVKAADFVEVFDENNESTGQFVLTDVVNEYGESSLIQPVVDNMFSYGSSYSLLLNESKAAKLVASYDESANAVTLVSARADDTLIKTFSYGGQTFDATITLKEVGTTVTESIENWLKSPTYLDPVDITGLKAFFEKIDEQKNYTVTSTGLWMNPSNGQIINTPANMSDLDGQGNGLHAYQSFDTVVGDTLVNHVSLMEERTLNWIAPSGIMGDYVLPTTNSVQAAYLKNGTLHTAKGTMTTQEDVIKLQYEPAQDTGNAIGTIWGTSLVHSGVSALLDKVSFVTFNKGTTTSPGDLYQFNTCGVDCDPTSEESLVLYTLGQDPIAGIVGGFSDFISYLSLDLAAFNANLLLDVLFGVMGKEIYFTSYFLVDEAAGTVSMVRMLNYSSTVTYYQETTWSDVGTTVLDDATKALLA